MRLESNGAFDIAFGAHAAVESRPGSAPIDPSGIVKGWAVARAGEMLRAAGASCFFVNAGGDVLTSGVPVDAPAGWRVGIQHPWERDRVAAVVAVGDRAVATSGRYERGDHVVDPRSGLPAEDLASVTVIGPDLAVADAYATAAVVLGPAAGMRWLATRAGYDGHEHHRQSRRVVHRRFRSLPRLIAAHRSWRLRRNRRSGGATSRDEAPEARRARARCRSRERPRLARV